MNSLFAFMGLGPMEVVVVVVIGVLLFGKRLPDMGRYLGKSITEFKKGMKGLEDDFDHTAAPSPNPRHDVAPDQLRPPQRVAATAPKFEDTPANVNPPQV